MTKLKQEWPIYEHITPEQRAERDPRGLARVTLLNDDLVIVEKLPEVPEVIELREEE